MCFIIEPTDALADRHDGAQAILPWAGCLEAEAEAGSTPNGPGKPA